MNVEYRRSVTDSEFDQIIGLADSNYADLVNKKTDPTLPTKDLLRTGLKTEISAYLREMSRPGGIPVSVVLVVSGEKSIIAFTMLTHSDTDADACGVNYCVVSEAHRNTGLARGMFDEIKQRFQSIGLSCPIGKVQIYEKLNFRVVSADGVQVAMIYGAKDYFPAMRTMDVSKTPAMKESIQRLWDKHGPKKCRKIQNRIDDNQKAESLKVKQFVRSKVAQ